MALNQSTVEQVFGQIWDSFLLSTKAGTKRRRAPSQLVLVFHFMGNYMKHPEKKTKPTKKKTIAAAVTTVTLKSANTNSHRDIRDMYIKQMKVEEDTGWALLPFNYCPLSPYAPPALIWDSCEIELLSTSWQTKQLSTLLPTEGQTDSVTATTHPCHSLIS